MERTKTLDIAFRYERTSDYNMTFFKEIYDAVETRGISLVSIQFHTIQLCLTQCNCRLYRQCRPKLSKA